MQHIYVINTALNYRDLWAFGCWHIFNKLNTENAQSRPIFQIYHKCEIGEKLEYFSCILSDNINCGDRDVPFSQTHIVNVWKKHTRHRQI